MDSHYSQFYWSDVSSLFQDVYMYSYFVCIMFIDIEVVWREVQVGLKCLSHTPSSHSALVIFASNVRAGCHSSVAQHWLHKSGVLGLIPGDCCLFTSLYSHLFTYILLEQESGGRTKCLST